MSCVFGIVIDNSSNVDLEDKANSLLAVRDINHKYIVVESILRLKERAEKLIFMNSFLSHIKVM